MTQIQHSPWNGKLACPGYFILFLFFKSASRSANCKIKKIYLNVVTLGYPIILIWLYGSVPKWNH